MEQISQSELFRLESMFIYEQGLKERGFFRIAGIDEAGRGPLAGPVVAAACILRSPTDFPFLNDSKKIGVQQRESLFAAMISSPFFLYGIGIVDVETIDRINILQATFLAMQKAVESLPAVPDYLLVDGNRSPFFPIPSRPIVKGDTLSLSIAAASICAKVTRDRIMIELDEKCPQYGFKEHKGYGTRDHLKAIHALGPSEYHRRSFEPLKSISNSSEYLLIKKGNFI